jgi:integrase
LDSETAEALRDYKRPLLEKSMSDGAAWDTSAWVFTHKSGSPLDPAKVYRMFVKSSAAAGLPKIRLHDLRHTVASLGLDTISDYARVSKMLGHSAVAFTMQTYAHVTPASQAETASAIAGKIRAPQKADVVKLLSNDG